MSMNNASLPKTRKPTLKFRLCYRGDFRGYTHHCSVLTWSEREYGPTGPQCSNPYIVGDRAAVSACASAVR